VRRLFLRRHRCTRAGVVHEHVEPAEALERPVDDAVAVVVDRDVGGHGREPRRIVDSRGERVESIRPASGGEHRGARTVKHPREPIPETARCACDDGDPPVEAEGRQHVFAHLTKIGVEIGLLRSSYA
jgi:hypothetical protein